MIRRSAVFAFALATIASAGPAAAQSGVAVGVLECRAGGSIGFIIGSVRNYECAFIPSGGGRAQFYWGRVTRVGLDLGFTNESALLWTVIAPTPVLGPGELDGNYGGVSAGVAVGVGVGANALVGGANNSFALQPLSIEGQTGVNVAAGVASFELRFIPDRVTPERPDRIYPVPPPPPPQRR